MLQNFEQMAAQFNTMVLIGPGLAAVLLGLFVWLGGLGFRKLLVAVAGAVSGAVCGFFIIGHNIIPAMVSAVLAVFIAVMFEKIFITILAAGLAAVFGFVVLVNPYVDNSAISRQYPEYEVHNPAASFSLRQTIETVKEYATDFSDELKRACSQMPAHNWAIIAALAAISIAAGFFLWRLTSALCYAALGTVLIFAGMILLLIYKGAEPVSYISRRQSFCVAVFAAMIAFGTIEQLLLCKPAKRPLTTKKETSKSDEEQSPTKPNWRTS